MIWWHGFEICLGTFLKQYWFSEALECSEEGTQWQAYSIKGSMFILMHISGSMIALSSSLNVFDREVKAAQIIAEIELEQ